MRWLSILILAFIITGCTAEQTEDAQQTKNEEAELSNAIPAHEIGESAQLGELTITLNHYLDVLVEQEGYDHVPRATQVTIFNESAKQQQLDFLQNYEWLASPDETTTNIMPALSQPNLPTSIKANEALSFYLVDYTNEFDYSAMQILKLEGNEEIVYLKLPQYVGTISEKNLPKVNTYHLQDFERNLSSIPTYQIDTFVTYKCPPLKLENLICKGDAQYQLLSFTYDDKQVELYKNEQLQYAKIQFEQDEFMFYFKDEILVQVTRNGEVITIEQWLIICTVQLLQLSDLVNSSLGIESTRTMNDQQIEDYITKVVRPAYEKSEAAINSGQIKAQQIGTKDVYELGNMRKEVHTTSDATYSAFFIDNQLVFVLKIEPNKVLTRYYIKDNELVRIVKADQSKEQYATTKDVAAYVESEQQLLEIVD